MDNLRGIHRYNPKYVFLTETNAIPDGYILKAAWKEAYPGEEVPKFYRIDPRALRAIMQVSKEGQIPEIEAKDVEILRRNVESFFKARIKDKQARILVYDEYSEGGQSPGAIMNLLKNPETFGFSNDIKCRHVRRSMAVSDDFYNASLEDDNFNPEKYNSEEYLADVSGTRSVKANNEIMTTRITKKNGRDLRGVIRAKKEIEKEINERTYGPRPEYSDWQKDFLNGVKEIHPGIRLIKMYNLIGREAGLELRQEEQKKKSLEHKLSGFIGISGLFFCILFLSNNITGNTIGSGIIKNWIGAISFIVGIIGTYWYFKNS